MVGVGEDDLCLITTLDGRRPLMEGDLWLKTIFNGRWMGSFDRWRITLYEWWPFMEDDPRWKKARKFVFSLVCAKYSVVHPLVANIFSSANHFTSICLFLKELINIGIMDGLAPLSINDWFPCSWDCLSMVCFQSTIVSITNCKAATPAILHCLQNP